MTENRTTAGSNASGKSRWIQNTFVTATFLLLFCSVVIPNSAQIFTAVVMVFCFLLSLSITKLNSKLVQLGYLYLLSVAVTIFYLIVGLHNGAPSIAVEQICIIYILSPLMWMYIVAGLMQTLGIEKLIRWFVLFSILSCLSIALFFYLFIYFGPDSVSFFQEKPNLDLSNGYVAATMFVYGSLIFICGGFFSTPELLGDKVTKALVLISLVIAALTSGRAALILSIPVGIILGWLIPTRTKFTVLNSPQRNRKITIPIWAAIFCAALILLFLPNVDVLHILESFSNKLMSGGGSARSEQVAALFNASMDANGVGSGHGVGVSYIRDDEYPWRYEAVWGATIFRVGLLGSLIYLLPFLWYLMKTLSLAKSRKLLPSQRFMFSGFVCAFLASNTNPYIESFVFQWMFVLPVVSLFTMHKYVEVLHEKHAQ